MAGSQPDEKVVGALLDTVGTNVDRLRQAIDALRPIHDHWKGDNSTSINLIAQLAALKSNLGHMHDWLNFAVSDMHPQLLLDVNVLMSSCGLLVQRLNALVGRLYQPHDSYDCAVRLKYALAGRSMERMRNVAQGQTEALALLLAACKCHATAQRKILLHKSRQIRSRDAQSLKMLARSSKVNAECIRLLTKASGMIQCFKYLLYVKLLRAEPQHELTEEEYDVAAATLRSDAIDRALQEDATTLRHEVKLVIAGDTSGSTELIWHQLKSLYADSSYSIGNREPHRAAVRSKLRLVIHAIIDLLKDTGISLPDGLNEQFAILLHEIETVDEKSITPECVQAVQRIWSSSEFANLYIQNFEIDFPRYAPYFAHEIQRIASSDYTPTEEDIVRTNRRASGMREMRFSWDELDVHFFNMQGWRSSGFVKRWFHQFEGSTLIWTVDVGDYDRLYFGQPSESYLVTDFISFGSWAARKEFANSSIIILLNNFSRFRDKLPFSPMKALFEDYVPSDADPETSARQYILRRYQKVNTQGLSIYSFWVDLDLGDNTPLYAALKKTLKHIQQCKAREEREHANPRNKGLGNRPVAGLADKLRTSRSVTSSWS